MSPDKLEAIDFRQNLGKSAVSYEGEEVSTAVPLLLDLVLPTLPPAGLAGTVKITDLLEGETLREVLGPSLVRLSESEVDWPQPAPRVLMQRGHSHEDLLVDLFDRGLLRVVDEEKIWTHRGARVTNGLFGVIKPTANNDKVEIDREHLDLLILIMNLVPSNALQRPQ